MQGIAARYVGSKTIGGGNLDKTDVEVEGVAQGSRCPRKWARFLLYMQDAPGRATAMEEL